jgi:geranylgeranyl transferase type-1 subunit beta
VILLGILVGGSDEASADVYHTYLSLAAAAMYAPRLDISARSYGQWDFSPFNPLLNAREETVRWARNHIPARRF